MEMIMVFVGNEPERLKAILKVLESKQINVIAKSMGYDIGYMAFFVYVDVALTEADEAMQALREAGFAVVCPGRHESPVSKFNRVEAMAVCA